MKLASFAYYLNGLKNKVRSNHIIGVQMKYSYYLECIGNTIALIPTDKAQTLSNAIHTCNDPEQDIFAKIIAIGRILI